MNKLITNYLKEIREVNKKDIKDKDKFLQDMLVEISFFQHERLIHLLVTIFVGISTIMFFGLALLLNNIGIIILGAITMILFLFYIFHYYFLENSIQELYNRYNELKK